MLKLIDGGFEHILLAPEDECLICGAPRSKMCFSWNMFHGEATSSCCGAVYQLKDYHIDKPTEEQKKLLEFLAGDYIEFCIKEEWIEPLKRALKELNKKNINDDEVFELAKSYVASED